MAAWRKHFLSFIATSVVAVLFAACDSACENAQEKLDECSDEIARASELGWSLPLSVSDECNDTDRCVAECVNNADCPAIAYGLQARTTDPNAPRSGAFGRCINACLPK